MTIPLWLVKVLNPIVATLLRSPLHGLMSADTMLITFRGRKSGTAYTTPVTYIRDDDRVRIFTESGWWRNCRDGAPVELVLAGETVSGRATAVAEDREAIAAGISELLRRVPRDAGYYDVTITNGEPDVAEVRRAAERIVMIDVAL